MSHANARLTVHGRAELVRRVVEQGRPVAHVVIELNVSRATGYKWLARWRAEGPAGLHDRSSRAHRLPTKTPAALEAKVLALRSQRQLGPARFGPLVGLPPSTVHAVLRRHGMHGWPGSTGRPANWFAAMSALDPASWCTSTSRSSAPSAPGGGWWEHGQGSAAQHHARTENRAGRRVGYDYVHCAIDDHTRLAYAEIHPDETAVTCAILARPPPGSPVRASAESSG